MKNLKISAHILGFIILCLLPWYLMIQDTEKKNEDVQMALQQGELYKEQRAFEPSLIKTLKQDQFYCRVLFFSKGCQEYLKNINQFFSKIQNHPKHIEYLETSSLSIQNKAGTIFILIFIAIYYFKFTPFSWNLASSLLPVLVISFLKKIEFKDFFHYFYIYTLFLIFNWKNQTHRITDLPFWSSKFFYSLSLCVIIYFSIRAIYIQNTTNNLTDYMTLECTYFIFFYFVSYLAIRPAHITKTKKG